MSNIQIETDLAEILKEIKLDQKKLLEEVNELKLGQAEIKGDIKALDTKVDQLDKRIVRLARSLAPFGDAGSLANQEFTNKGVLIGLVIVILGGAAKFFGLMGNQ